MIRFSIRDLMWLTILAAVGAAWWMDRRQMDALRLKSKELESMKCAVRDAGLEEVFSLLIKFRDPSQAPALKQAFAAMNPSTPPDQWTDDEMSKAIKLLNASQPPTTKR